MEFSKCQKKIRDTWEETESGRIALAIYDWRLYLEHNRKLKVLDSITLETSEDALVLYVWKPVECKSNRSWYKIIPNHEFSVEQMAKILDAQPWVYL